MPHRPSLAVACAALALGFSVALPATAQQYPAKPVKLIVPFAAGGGTDAAARIVADRLSRVLGQQFFVENRPGSAALIGIEAAARSPADGYTVLVVTDTLTVVSHILKMAIDPMQALVPVVQLARQPAVLSVHPSLGVNSVAELVALAQQQPGMNYVTSGLSSPQNVVAQWFARTAGIRLDHVLYRGGGQAINDLIAGHVRIGSLGPAPLVPHYRAGSLRLLAQSGAARSPSLPDVPTYREAGIHDVVLDQWLGVFVPVGTPPAVSARLNAEINSALAQPEVRDHFMQQAQEPVGGTTEQFSKVVRLDFEKYGRLLKDLNIKTE